MKRCAAPRHHHQWYKCMPDKFPHCIHVVVSMHVVQNDVSTFKSRFSSFLAWHERPSIQQHKSTKKEEPLTQLGWMVDRLSLVQKKIMRLTFLMVSRNIFWPRSPFLRDSWLNGDPYYYYGRSQGCGTVHLSDQKWIFLRDSLVDVVPDWMGIHTHWATSVLYCS